MYKIPNFYILGEWFLGCIIIMYLFFPILRKLLINYPKLLLSFIIIIYILVVQRYIFKVEIDRNILTRLPEFVFGMFFIKYIKKISIYQFILAIIISIIMLYVNIRIFPMYKITITGISLFIVLAFIGQSVRIQKIKKLFYTVSKYSYAIFLVHHVIIEQLVAKFDNKKITFVESYCLFFIVCICISVVSIYLYAINDKIKLYIKICTKEKQIRQ